MAKFEEVTLDTVCEGSARELFARGLKEVLDNIQDVSTDPERKRKLSLVFSFSPSENRASSSVSLDCEIKIVPVSSIGGTVFIAKESGVRKAYASSARQEPLYPAQETGQAGTPTKVHLR